MKGKKDNQETKDESVKMDAEVMDNAAETKSDEKTADDSNAASIKEIECIKAELEEKNRKCEEYVDKLQRTAAEFDNFKKRTAREKEALYAEAVCDVTAAILPVVDNLERALTACSKENDFQALKDGVDLVFRQMKDSLKKIGVEEINCENADFDPQLHNAVMHVEDESLGQNCVIEEFQKGYIYKDKVIRHSMVKVAN